MAMLTQHDVELDKLNDFVHKYRNRLPEIIGGWSRMPIVIPIGLIGDFDEWLEENPLSVESPEWMTPDLNAVWMELVGPKHRLLIAKLTWGGK